MPWLLQFCGCMHTHESLHAPAAFGAGTETGALLLLSLFLSSQAACVYVQLCHVLLLSLFLSSQAACVCLQLCHVLLLSLSSALTMSASACSCVMCCCSAFPQLSSCLHLLGSVSCAAAQPLDQLFSVSSCPVHLMLRCSSA